VNELIAQKDAVDDKRKLLDQITRTESIIYLGDPSQPDQNQDPEKDPEEKAAPHGATFVDARGEFERSERELQRLTTEFLTSRHLTIGSIRAAKLTSD